MPRQTDSLFTTRCQQFLRKEYWTAFERDWDLGRPVGYGFTESDAVADLREQLKEAEQWRA